MPSHPDPVELEEAVAFKTWGTRREFAEHLSTCFRETSEEGLLIGVDWGQETVLTNWRSTGPYTEFCSVGYEILHQGKYCTNAILFSKIFFGVLEQSRNRMFLQFFSEKFRVHGISTRFRLLLRLVPLWSHNFLA